MASYVLYGFDTAGTLAEETGDPRRRAPWAILRASRRRRDSPAACSSSPGSWPSATRHARARRDHRRTALDRQARSLGRELGKVFLGVVIFAVIVCALAVHAGTVRLIFAMARDNSLPFARILARVQHETRTPGRPGRGHRRWRRR